MTDGGGKRKTEVVSKITREDLIVGASCLDKILSHNLDIDAIIQKAKQEKTWLITSEFIDEYVLNTREERLSLITPKDDSITDSETTVGESVVEVLKSKKNTPCDIESQLVIHEDRDVSGKSTCEGKITDFIKYFNSRYNDAKKILGERVEYRVTTTIDQLKSSRINDKTKIIAMVNAKRESDKGYKFLDVEDPTDKITIFIGADQDMLINTFNRILPDEIIGIEGILRNDLFIATGITQPDIPLNRTTHTAEEEVYALFLSDIHVGSYLFLEREFESFIRWLNGHGDRKDLSSKVKYLFVAGDLVDGIGIYPGQEKELTIPDIYKQYDFLSLMLENVPEHIEIILGMGNHDAVRLAEPQPRLPQEIAETLYEIPNVHVVGNPARITAHGVNVLMYHGTSLDTIISNIPGCSYNQPEYAMIEYIKRRNLVPTYGRDSILPEDKDYLFINEVPDIFHCGHVHTNGYANYKGVHLINSGTWQGKTKYQEQLGHQPTPARVPVMNLANHELTMLHFGD